MKISKAEGRILEILWQVGEPVAADDVVAALGDEAGWSAGTVRTFLTRLVKKKAASAEQDGRRYLYTPLIERAAYVQAESQGLLDRLFEGRLTPLVHHFSEHGALTADDLAKLKALIAEIEKKHG